jgi:hypothetical protein
MGEFFRGWRMKLGSVTLVMACIVASFWIRSMRIGERFSLPIGDNTDASLLSYNGRIVASLDSHPFGRRQFGFKSGYQFQAGPELWPIYHTFYFSCSDWGIAIPLTLLSAYLLLSKPRGPIAKKPAEPTLVEGA